MLRLSYLADLEDPDLVEARLAAIKAQVTQAWPNSRCQLSAHRGAADLLAPRRAGATPSGQPGGAQVNTRLKKNMLTKSIRLPLLALCLMTATAVAQTAGIRPADATGRQRPGHEGRADGRFRRAPSDPATRTFRPAVRDPSVLEQQDGDRMEKQQVDGQVMETVKLSGIIAPLHFDSGAIPSATRTSRRSGARWNRCAARPTCACTWSAMPTTSACRPT